MNNEASPGTKKRKKGHIAMILVIVVIAAIVGVDEFVLCGDVVVSTQLKSSSPATQTLAIDQIGEEHTVKLRTMGSDGAELGIKLTDPNGEVLFEIDEHVRHQSHYFTFTPKVAGDHILALERQDGLLGTGRVLCKIKVYVNDRRIFTPLFYSLGM